jgi:hypothetical protein
LTILFRTSGTVFSLRRLAAVLAGAALLNAFVAPTASACRSDVAPEGSVAAASEHGQMHGDHAVAPSVAESGSKMIGEPASCAGHDAACIARPGCSATAFVVPEAPESGSGAGSGVMIVSATELRDHSSAPDHPPPRV